MTYARTRIPPKNGTYKILYDFELQIDPLIPARWPVLINKRKRTCRLVNSTISADHGVNIRENEKLGKYLNFARELRKCETWNNLNRWT